jgi:hypothetical protein
LNQVRKIAWDVLEVKFVTGRMNCLFVALIVLVFTWETSVRPRHLCPNLKH